MLLLRMLIGFASFGLAVVEDAAPRYPQPIAPPVLAPSLEDAQGETEPLVNCWAQPGPHRTNHTTKGRWTVPLAGAG